MAVWTELNHGEVGAKLDSIVGSITDVLNTISTALKLLTTAIEVIKGLAFASLNLLKSIVEAIVTLIEELLHDLLEFNVAMALHVNMNWNPFWVMNREKERDPRTGKLDPRLVDYQVDGQFPWSGSGLVGWLLDVLQSTKDPTNPFRPVTDSNTKVYGVIILDGIANPADAENGLRLDDWYNLFTNWESFKVDFSTVNTDPFIDSTSKLGTTALLAVLAPLYRMGPKDQQLLPIKAFVDENLQISKFSPVAGNYPKWVSIPMAALVPPLQAGFEDLRKVLGMLRFSDDLVDALSKLIDAINAKVDVIQEALQQIQDAIALAIALAEFFSNAFILVLDVPDGGMDRFIGDAISASNPPNFGDAGIVVGATLVATNPDSQATIDKFLEIIGINTADYLSDTNAYSAQLDESFEELFPPEEP